MSKDKANMDAMGHVYDPKHEIVKTQRYSRITFGIGDRPEIKSEKPMK